MKYFPVRVSSFIAAAYLVSSFICSSLFAGDDTPTVVVTATRHATEISNVSTHTTVIDSRELELRGHDNAAEALRDIAGFDISQTGGPGGISAPQIRGLTGKWILILIDGVRMNDPADANNAVGTILSHLNTDDIERIEIVRGPQSPLYGSSAAAGVINIITRKGRGDGSFRFGYEGGSLNSQRVSGSYGVNKNGFGFQATQSYTYAEGNVDLEYYRNHTTSIKGSYSNDKLDWTSTVRYTAMQRNFGEFIENYSGDIYGYEFADPNQTNDYGYMTIGNTVTHKINDFWSQTASFGVSWRDRRTTDPDDGVLGTFPAPGDGFTLDWMSFYDKGSPVPVLDNMYAAYSYGYKGINYDADYRQNLAWSGDNYSDILTAGATFLAQDYNQWGDYGALDKSLNTWSVYAHNQVLLADESLAINTGMRLDDQQETDANFSAMAGISNDIRSLGLLWRANVGSSFRAPSIYEVYEPQYGNPALEPETALSYEFGLEKYASDKSWKIGVNYFHNEIDHLIIWSMVDPATYSYKYINADKAESKGVEATIAVYPHENWSISANYTYTDSRVLNEVSDIWSRQVQVPYNKLNLNLTYSNGRGSVSLDSYLVDDSRLRWNKLDSMDSYTKVDITGRLNVNETMTGILKLRNIFDVDYYETWGQKETGAAVYGGLELDF